jgi:N-acyl-D-aspartate/D-glutamate deacylase
MDTLIKDGNIIDGSGNPWYQGNVGIAGGKIVHVGTASRPAANEIDAAGLVVCPGFIDTHSHSDFLFLDDPLSSFKVMQGATTEVVGNCGFSAVPVPKRKKNFRLFNDYISQINPYSALTIDWTSMKGYITRLRRSGMPNNLVALVGHGNLRIAAMGMDNRPPDQEELNYMKGLLESALKSGAKGLSTGLMYPPGFYCDVSEITELAHVVKNYGGILTSHIRNYAEGLEDSVRELIQVGQEATIPIHISHITSAQEPNWGKMDRVLEMVDDARQNGVDVTMDRYPYTAANTTLRSILPPSMQEGGVTAMLERMKDQAIRKRCADEIGNKLNWHTMIVNHCHVHQDLNQKSMADIAKAWDKDIHEALFDLLLDEKGEPRIIFFIHSEEDMKTALNHPTVMIGSDSDPGGPDSHPRTYGTFPKILRDMVLEQGLLSLEDAIRKMTSLPAQRFGLQDRGLIRKGMAADIAVIDMNRVRDRSTYDQPCLQPEGIEYVFLNGEMIVEKGAFLGKSAGKILLS